MDEREPAGPPCLERQPSSLHKRMGVFGDKTERATARRVGPIFVQLDVVDHLIRWVVLAFGAHDGDLIAIRDERLALKPYSPVERNWQVLDDYEDAGHRLVLL